MKTMTQNTTYKNTEIGSIPVDWEVKPLEKYFSFISYGFTNPMPSAIEGIYLITAADVNYGQIQIETARKTTEKAYKYLLTDKSRPKKNDILLTKDGTLGRLALVKDEIICINQSVAVIRPNNKIIPQFLKILLESSYYQKVMIDNAGGSTIKHIYITVVNKMLIIVPPTLTEQTAIANALSDADALINKVEKFITKKRNIKQGAMQKLLQQKEGWDMKRLGEILKIRHGKDQKAVQSQSGQYPILGTGGLMGYANSFLYDKESVLIGRKGTIDKPKYMNSPFWTVDTLFYSEILKGNSAKFIYYIFLTIDWYSYNESSGVPSLNAKTIENIEFAFPPLKTQIKIAQILSDMDLEIAGLESKLSKYRAIKTGMMQQLLTGRIRLV